MSVAESHLLLTILQSGWAGLLIKVVARTFTMPSLFICLESWLGSYDVCGLAKTSLLVGKAGPHNMVAQSSKPCSTKTDPRPPVLNVMIWCSQKSSCVNRGTFRGQTPRLPHLEPHPCINPCGGLMIRVDCWAFPLPVPLPSGCHLSSVKPFHHDGLPDLWPRAMSQVAKD